jgi:hypothetical protein
MSVDKRVVTGKGDIIVLRIWHVPLSVDYPDGIRFSFVFIHDDRRYLGYDNAEQKGCHCHHVDPLTGAETEKVLEDCAPMVLMRRFKSEMTQLMALLYNREG